MKRFPKAKIIDALCRNRREVLMNRNVVQFNTTPVQDSIEEGSNKCYVELPDGYRLIFKDGKYEGRYNPNLNEVLS